jgi:hypothetical protein
MYNTNLAGRHYNEEHSGLLRDAVDDREAKELQGMSRSNSRKLEITEPKKIQGSFRKRNVRIDEFGSPSHHVICGGVTNSRDQHE